VHLARARDVIGEVRRYRTIVVGLGAMGSAAAAALARRGADVLGVEQFGPFHDRGSSHGDSRIVRMAYFEHPDYVPLLRLAYDGWAALETACKRQLVTWTGALMIGPPDSAVVAGTLASARRWELAHELLDRGEMAAQFGQFRLSADEVAVYERDAGVVNPELALPALHEQARLAGAELRFESPVEGWEVGATGVTVGVGGEDVAADHVVVAAGPWAAKLLGPAFPLTPVRTVTYHLEPAGDPGMFAPDRFPAFVWELAPGDALYGLADVGCGAPKVGFHHRRRVTDPDGVDRNVAPEELAAMRAVLAERIPALTGRCLASTVCLYTMTPDEHFVIGHLPGSEGRVSIAAGFSGHGFKFVPVVGDILADLAIDGSTDAPIALFDPTRFTPA
jgi:sarcosine oxidase